MQVDLLILGGGCAGLSLAVELVRTATENPPIVTILEKRIHYENDRTWGYWSNGTDYYPSISKQLFPQLRVRVGNDRAADVCFPCQDAPYTVLASHLFYDHCLKVIRAQKETQLVLGAEILGNPIRKNQRWQVHTQAMIYEAKAIVDTRPPPTSSLPVRTGLYQSFYGFEIECEEEVFDPTAVELMSFEENTSFPIFFTYVIPFSKNRALIEATVFGPDPLQQEDLKDNLERMVQKHSKGSRFRILRKESGILPMGIPIEKAVSDPSYVRVGVNSGAARPSTGYAFQRIQKWASLCAREIHLRKRPIHHSSDPWLIRWMDAIFISVLKNHPSIAPSLFLRLFRNVAPMRLIRFLSGNGTVFDCIRIILALPAGLFLNEISRVREGLRG